jgi:exoribonuclease R
MLVNNRIAGTLELTSKVRYGLTSRGVPLFRFVPYDKRFGPMAVGCSQRNLFYNIHAIVEPSTAPQRQGELPKANIVQNLGEPTDESELKLLLTTYAYDSQKDLSAKTQKPTPLTEEQEDRHTLDGTTFHIDPPGCKDVDDSFTVYQISETKWTIAINIADVSSRVLEGSALDLEARRRATSFYTPGGDAIQPMFAREFSEDTFSLLPGKAKPTLSLCFDVEEGAWLPANLRWMSTLTQTTLSYTYDEADKALETSPELKTLQKVTRAPDSHVIVERLMIFYNEEAGKMLSSAGTGILRRQKGGAASRVQIPGVPEFLFYESAEYCLPTADSVAHEALGLGAYAYASSPIRRYADIVNQRAIKAALLGKEPSQEAQAEAQALVDEMNRRQKQAKAFQRDLFFMTTLSKDASAEAVAAVQGTVISVNSEKRKARVWVPAWKTAIQVKNISADIKPSAPVSIQWYENRQEARWKDKIVFKLLSP